MEPFQEVYNQNLKKEKQVLLVQEQQQVLKHILINIRMQFIVKFINNKKYNINNKSLMVIIICPVLKKLSNFKANVS